MPKTVILGSARTPIGKLGGGLSTLKATELGGVAISAALERANVDPEQVDHVVMGQVLQAGQGQIPSRQAQIGAGIPKEVSSETINKVCASGLRATVILDQAIRAGDVEVGVGGGMESMSQAPYLLPQARFGYRMGDAKALDAMVHDGLTNPFSGRQMFDEAERAHAGGADLVNGLRGDFLGDAALDLGLARGDLPLAGLQHLAIGNGLDLVGLDARALERLGDRDAAEVGRVERGERAAELADGRASGGEDHGLGHGGEL